jgi:hypothetical protein
MHCYSKAECEAIFCVKLCASISGTLEIFELATAFFFFALLPEKVLLSGVISGALLYIRDEFPAVRDNYLLQVQSSLLITARYNMESPHV